MRRDRRRSGTFGDLEAPRRCGGARPGAWRGSRRCWRKSGPGADDRAVAAANADRNPCSMAYCPVIYGLVAGATQFAGRMSERLLVCYVRCTPMYNLCLMRPGTVRCLPRGGIASGRARDYSARPAPSKSTAVTIEFGNAHWEHAHEPCRAKACVHRHWRLTRHHGARG
jgi:hypothetical protein